jgi:hypothetical protein
VRRYLTLNPKSEAGRAFKELAKTLSKTDKASFKKALEEWETQWCDFLKERTTNPETGKSRYIHKRLAFKQPLKKSIKV